MQEPLISVIVPIYNSEKYLFECLNSLKSQTYQNLEFILVDDGSTDQSFDICMQYSNLDSRFKVIQQKNKGASEARNIGLKTASGQWIGFVDSDDWVEQEMYSVLWKIAFQTGADIVQCGTFGEPCGDPKKIIRVSRGGFKYFEMEDWNRLSNRNWDKLYRRSIIKNICFCSEFSIGEDLVFNLEALQCAKSVAFYSVPQYHYRIHIESLCHGIPDFQTIFSLRRAIFYGLKLTEKTSSATAALWHKQFQNNLDICSKIAKHEPQKFKYELSEIRNEIRHSFFNLLKDSNYTQKEKIKFLLAGFFWPAYQQVVRNKK